jgi:hypothetical protein
MPHDTDNLHDLIRRKHHHLTQMHGLGLRQLQAVQESDYGLLLKLLAAKQSLLDGLQVLERRIDPYRGEAPADRIWRSQQQRQECAQLLDECEALLREVVQQELQSQQALAVARDEAADMLQLGAAAATAHSAYLHVHQPAVGQLDLSAEN